MSSTGGDGSGDIHQRDVFDAFELVKLSLATLARSDVMAEQLHIVRESALGGLHVGVAGAFEAGDQAKAVEDVFFLAFDAADIANAVVGTSRAQPAKQRLSVYRRRPSWMRKKA